MQIKPSGKSLLPKKTFKRGETIPPFSHAKKQYMNQLDYIDQLRNNEVKVELILDHLACWFSADQIEEFFKDFVRIHDITFGDEDDM